MRGMEFKSVPLEIKELSDEGRFEGWGAIFDEEDMGGDTIKRGAFKKSLETITPKIYLEHTTSVGKLDVAVEKKKGLWVEGQPDESPDGFAARAKLKSGALDSLSIGYKTVTAKEKPGFRRDLLEVKLFHVGIVPFGMHDGALVTSVKALDLEGITTIRELECALRDAGVSRKSAEILCSPDFIAALKRGDPVEGGAELVATLESATAKLRQGG